MLRRPALFDELDASLAASVPRDPVEFSGSWLPSERRTYQAGGKAGTGSGPLIDVLDQRWRGTLACAVPIAGVAFLVTVDDIFWVKSTPATLVQPVDVSFHAHANGSAEQATFTAGMGGGMLPGVPVADDRDAIRACTMSSRRLTTARVEQLSELDDAAFCVLLLPGEAVRVGRHRLWHLRPNLATTLPPPVREILTRRRSGTEKRRT